MEEFAYCYLLITYKVDQDSKTVKCCHQTHRFFKLEYK